MNHAADASLRNANPYFDLTDEHVQTLDLADTWARQELYDIAPRMDKDEWWPDNLMAKIGEA
ncbi:MAG: hypothetical protein K2P94_08195, partial [Rhodospirillaceae bacterium]|nr:hypothetical protein [Rhodospirillaceae bacterium]